MISNPEALPELRKQQVGRYAIFDEIAAGGMATVHLARLAGPVGFSRVVAVKRLHPHLLDDQDFKAMFLDEARLAARIRHPNVVPTLDVLVNDKELILVMEYVHGESLLALTRAARQKKAPIPLSIAVAIMVSVLHGLHAAHEARDEKGQPLGIVHRDISPHNILAGADGMVRVLDFGVAKALQGRSAELDTALPPGTVKGKFSYMAPETLRGEPSTRQADIFSAAIVLWELVTGHKLFGAPTEQERILKVLKGNIPPPSALVPGLPVVVDKIVLRGLSPHPLDRYETADEMAAEIENMLSPASQRVVGEWVSKLASEALERRADLLQQIEVSNINSTPPVALGKVVASSTAVAPSASPLSSMPGETTPITSPRSLGRSGKLAIAVGVAALSVGALTLVTRALRSPSAVDAPLALAPTPVAEGPTAAPHDPIDQAQDPGPPVASPLQAKAAEPSDGAKAAPTQAHPVSAPRPTRHVAPRPSGNAKDFLPSHL
ncbi:MAG TPA: protein kinase [Polyangiaceae bacterium]|nr:protein kinase [Polyangiaceae bacterium]